MSGARLAGVEPQTAVLDGEGAVVQAARRPGGRAPVLTPVRTRDPGPARARRTFAEPSRAEPVVPHRRSRVGHTCAMFRFKRPTRAAVAALGLTTALTLSACSDLPEVNITTEQLTQFVEDAKAQVQTIAADAKTLGASIGDLPESVRSTAQDAITSAQSAAGKATGALEDAQAEGSDARQKLDEAKTALDDATTKLTDLRDAAGENVTPEVQ